MSGPYFGKYRGVVADNVDPLAQHRVRVVVPEVLGDATAWATACLPVGYFAVPPVGAGVWVEFEGGDPDRPVWVGSYFTSDVPIPVHEGAVEVRAGDTVLSVAADGVDVTRWRRPTDSPQAEAPE